MCIRDRFAERVRGGGNVHVAMVFPAGEAATTPYQAARDLLDGMARDSYRVLVGSDVGLMDRIFGRAR